MATTSGAPVVRDNPVITGPAGDKPQCGMSPPFSLDSLPSELAQAFARVAAVRRILRRYGVHSKSAIAGGELGYHSDLDVVVCYAAGRRHNGGTGAEIEYYYSRVGRPLLVARGELAAPRETIKARWDDTLVDNGGDVNYLVQAEIILGHRKLRG